jgi:hypothetical protein
VCDGRLLGGKPKTPAISGGAIADFCVDRDQGLRRSFKAQPLN